MTEKNDARTVEIYLIKYSDARTVERFLALHLKIILFKNTVFNQHGGRGKQFGLGIE